MSDSGEANTRLLIRYCLKGDHHAQRKLFDRYYDAMYTISYRIVQNQQDAQDILQEAFLKAFSGLRQLKNPEFFGGWLRSIVINKSLNFLRKYKSLTFTNEFDDLAEETCDPEEPFTISPEKIMSAVDELPSGCRTILLLYLVEDFKQSEIATMLGISVSTVKSQFQRAKSILRNNLTQVTDENEI